MRVMLVGGGGREHCLAWKICQSPLLDELVCCPGNAGISSLARCLPTKDSDLDGLLQVALKEKIELVLVGPEAPLASGIKDVFSEKNIAVFGPGKEGARLESSKAWAKEFMSFCSIPTAAYAVFQEEDAALAYVEKKGTPIVVKADGLAAGKGVTVAKSAAEARLALKKIFQDKVFGEAGSKVVLEECLEGEEVSVLALTDGKEIIVLPSAQDHKAAFEGDEGPNTGGMGAYSPAPILTEELADEVKKKVFLPLLKGLQQKGISYQGIIYAGLMLGKRGLNVLEFNVRFGDPEAQAIIPRLQGDLLELILAATRGELSQVAPRLAPEHALCVVLASGGYPAAYNKGYPISGLEKLKEMEKVLVFHAGTTLEQEKVVTAGGRVLNIVGIGKTLEEAYQRAYQGVEKIHFQDVYFRRDIGFKALPQY